MSVTKKVFLLICSVFALYGVAGWVVGRAVILRSFEKLEQSAATDNTQRVIEALNREVALLVPSANDWATWDDTYAYMVDRNAAYAEGNLNPVSLESLKVNYIGFFDPDGRKVWALAYDLDAEQTIPLDELGPDTLAADHPLLTPHRTLETVAGIYPTSQGPMIVAARPILTSEGDGPSRGIIVMGRFLDNAAITAIGQQAKVRVRSEGPSENSGPGDLPREKTDLIFHSPVFLEESAEMSFGRVTLYNLYDAPALHLTVETPRTIVAQGKETLYYARMFLAGAGLLVLLVLAIFLRRSVFTPVQQLMRHVIAVGENDDLTLTLHLSRRDEIGILAREFNGMVARLSEARRKLLDQSYHSGVAEMASGVLHNIGNAVTPLGVKVAKVKQDLRQAPLAEMEMAALELSDPHCPADRRQDLMQFVQLAGQELAGVVQRTAAEMDLVQNQLDHVQLILADQRRFSKAERVIETLPLNNLVDETVRLLPEALHRHVTIEIDPGLAEVGRVRAARVALQQIMSNLLINAAESIRQSGHKADTGRVRIHAVEEDQDGQGKVRLSVEDNGGGIAPDILSRLFERGFSTKNRGSGMGLHWSANTAAAMGGRLYAESPGPGLGAVFHLLLPTAQPTFNSQEITA